MMSINLLFRKDEPICSGQIMIPAISLGVCGQKLHFSLVLFYGMFTVEFKTPLIHRRRPLAFVSHNMSKYVGTGHYPISIIVCESNCSSLVLYF